MDLANAYKIGQSLLPVARTASANGTGIDFNDCGPEISAILDVGAVTGTTPTLDVKLQESDDNSTFTDISGATFAQIGDADNQVNLKTFFNRSKRYVRAVATIGGTTPSFTCGVSLLGRKTSY